MEKEKQNKIDSLIEDSIKNLSAFIDVNSIIGTPILSGGKTIIPVAKVTSGIVTGGGEYGEVKYFKKDENYPFTGASGSVVSITPQSFLIDNGHGFKIVPAGGDAIDKLLDAFENLICSIKDDD